MTNGNCKANRFFNVVEFTMTTAKTREFDPACSGSEEEEFLEVEEVHSPTDSSEDSVEVKVSPICLRNKRKCAEPRKTFYATAPPKKRMCFKRAAEEDASSTRIAVSKSSCEPFRPWNVDQTTTTTTIPDVTAPSKSPISIIVPVPTKPDPDCHGGGGGGFLVPPPPHQHQPVTPQKIFVKPLASYYDHHLHHQHHFPERPTSPTPLPLSLVKKPTNNPEPTPVVVVKQEPPDTCEPPRVPSLHQEDSSSLTSHQQQSSPSSVTGRKEQRNYKNMTRERRIEANARERTRVHTISAAFETLRRSVPAYSHNQKLSKLSVLRIACSYIMTLSTLVGDDDPSATQDDEPTLAQCVESVSKTIQKEGKLKKKKDESD